MNIIRAKPPNYMELVQCGQFKLSRSTIYAYGESIYFEGDGQIDEALLAHEGVHGERQMAIGIDLWWTRYIEDRAFRFEEELLGHQAEWRVAQGFPTRPQRRARLKEIEERLSGPLYGRMVTKAVARRLIVGKHASE